MDMYLLIEIRISLYIVLSWDFNWDGKFNYKFDND